MRWARWQSMACAYYENVSNTTHANLAGIELAKQYPLIYCSIGIHPDQAAEIAAQNSREYLDVIASQLSYEKSDGFRRNRTGLLLRRCLSAGCPAQNFEEQLALAKDLDVPVIIHNRDAHQDTLELNKYRPRASCTAFPARQRSQRDAAAGDVHRLHRCHHLQKCPSGGRSCRRGSSRPPTD